MRVLRLVTVVAASAALATGLAACGDDDDSGGTTSAAPTVTGEVKPGPITGWSDGGFAPDLSSLECSTKAANPTRGITDTEIKVGGLAYLTSPSGSTMSGVDLGAKARFERANEEGGINGRKIDFVGVLDDGNDAARNLDQARVLADQEEVFAVVPLLTSHASYVDVLCNEVVPFFGWGINPGFCGNTIGFGITGCLVAEGRRPAAATTYGIALQSLNGGSAEGLKVAILGSDSQSAVNGVADMVTQVETVGADVVYAETPIPAAGLTDATALVNDLMTAADGAPPDILLHVLDFTTTNKVIEAMAAAGYEGKHLTAVGYDPRLAAAGMASMQGVNSILQWAPAESDAQAVQQLRADLAKYTPDAVLSLPTMAGYWAADFFVRAATAVGPDLTVDALLELLNGGYTHSVEGALAETRWPLNHVINNPCMSVVQLDGNAYKIAADLACGSLVKLNS
ncbi:MAG: ABC transporter substrate-binding protein [Frankia sp.]|nr:ABC transporter substrate-binding protein [Frankia sp.]